MSEVKILDVSHWVRPVWGEWAEQVGVYMKLTEGASWEDNYWKRHYAESPSTMYKGGYHYFHGSTNGAVQATHMWTTALTHDWDMRPVIDVEKHGNIKSDGTRLISKAVFAARLRNCLITTEELWGIRPMIYTSRSMWHFLVGSVSWASAYDLWTAHYTSYPVPLIPDDWKGKGYRMWQFIDRPVDQNRFHGTHAEYLKWMGKDVPGPQVLQPGDYRVL